MSALRIPGKCEVAGHAHPAEEAGNVNRLPTRARFRVILELFQYVAAHVNKHERRLHEARFRVILELFQHVAAHVHERRHLEIP